MRIERCWPTQSYWMRLFHTSTSKQNKCSCRGVEQECRTRLYTHGYEKKAYTVVIADRLVRQFRIKKIPMVKVLWSNHITGDQTWKIVAEMRIVYPICFLDEFFYPFLSFKIRGRIFIIRGDCNALNFILNLF